MIFSSFPFKAGVYDDCYCYYGMESDGDLSCFR
jgi:hypothetical protein